MSKHSLYSSANMFRYCLSSASNMSKYWPQLFARHVYGGREGRFLTFFKYQKSVFARVILASLRLQMCEIQRRIRPL
jgi:hypothetical protein